MARRSRGRLAVRACATSVGHPLLGEAELEGGEQDHERHQDHRLRRRKTELQPFEAVLPRAVDQDRGRVAGPTLRRDLDPGLPRVEGRLRRAAARFFGGAVGGPDGARDPAHRLPVPLRRGEGDLLMSRTLAPPTALAIGAPSRVKARDWSGIVAHAILLAAVAVLAFPP